MKKYYDITFLYVNGDADRLAELSKHVAVVKFTGQTINTDVCIYATANWDVHPDKYIIATEKHIQTAHADYKEALKLGFKYLKAPKVTEHVSVSKIVAKSLKEMYGYDSTVIYNLLDVDVKPQKVLKLITASRISEEKGFDLLVKMAKRLKKHGRPFLWFVYGESNTYALTIREQLKDIPDVLFMGSRLDLTDMLAECDYLAQLSRSEGFCYSINEALQVGTPVIATNFPSIHEQIDEKSGYILNMDLSNLDIDALYDKIPKGFVFKEKSSEQDWCKLIDAKSKPIKLSPTVRIKIIQKYDDTELGRKVKTGEKFTVKRARFNELVKVGVAEEIFD